MFWQLLVYPTALQRSWKLRLIALAGCRRPLLYVAFAFCPNPPVVTWRGVVSRATRLGFAVLACPWQACHFFALRILFGFRVSQSFSVGLGAALRGAFILFSITIALSSTGA
jgi:hypothetical protein